MNAIAPADASALARAGRIVGFRSWLVYLPYNIAMTWGSGTRTGGTRLVVELTTESGIKGYGETICLLDFIEPVLHKVVMPLAVGRSVSEVERIHRHVLGAGYYHHKRAAVMALCAVEMAMWDALGKLAGLPLSALWGGQWRDAVEVSAYLFMADHGALAETAREFRRQGYDSFKIKVGAGEANDLRTVETVRGAIGAGVHLRADVNGGWTPGTARRQLQKLLQYDLAYIEQPLELDDLAGHAELRRVQPIPVALDESAYTLSDVGNIVRMGAADVILLDPHEMGGLWQVRKAAAIPESVGLGMTLHSGGELGFSQAALVHLAASIPTMTIAIDTEYYYYDDDIVADRLAIAQGRMAVPQAPGLGVAPDFDKLEKYRVDAIRGAYLDDKRPGWFPMKPSY